MLIILLPAKTKAYLKLCTHSHHVFLFMLVPLCLCNTQNQVSPLSYMQDLTHYLFLSLLHA